MSDILYNPRTSSLIFSREKKRSANSLLIPFSVFAVRESELFLLFAMIRMAMLHAGKSLQNDRMAHCKYIVRELVFTRLRNFAFAHEMKSVKNNSNRSFIWIRCISARSIFSVFRMKCTMEINLKFIFYSSRSNIYWIVSTSIPISRRLLRFANIKLKRATRYEERPTRSSIQIRHLISRQWFILSPVSKLLRLSLDVDT